MLIWGNPKSHDAYHRHFLNCYPCPKNVLADRLIPITVSQGFEQSNNQDFNDVSRIPYGGISLSAKSGYSFKAYGAHNGHAYQDHNQYWNHHVIVIDFYRPMDGVLYSTLYGNLNPETIPANIPNANTGKSVEVQAGEQLGMIDHKNISIPHLFFSILRWDKESNCQIFDPFGLYKKDGYPTLGCPLGAMRHFWISPIPTFPG